MVGLGYIGLPTAALLALRGFDVVGIDTSPEVLKTLTEGKVHIAEPDLDVSVSAAIKSGALAVSPEPCPADVFIIAVPTPLINESVPDISFVEGATREVSKYLKSGDLVVLESTCPVGTTQKVAEWIAEERNDLVLPHQDEKKPDISVAHCPERVLPGQIMKELVENDRTIGGISRACTEKAKEFYQDFVQGQCFPSDAATAEMVKLTENAYRDVNIAFANELSLLADKHGVNVWELIKLANRHPRVNVLNPGPGVGGHCIAVDPWFLVASDPERANLIRTAREVNDNKPRFVVDQVKHSLEGVDKPQITCLGLTFKADVDDLRESPAVEICLELARIKTATISVVEPHIEALPISFSDHPNVHITRAETAITTADTIVLLVDHSQFRDIPSRFDITHSHVIDTRGIWESV